MSESIRMMVVSCLFCAAVNAEVRISPATLEVRPDQPTLVEADLKDVSVQEAFDIICGAAPVPCRVEVQEPAASRLITLELKGTPWAEAMVRIAREANLGLSRFQGSLVYYTPSLPANSTPDNFGARWVYGPCVNSGAFCGILDRIESRRSINFESTPPSDGSITIVVDTVPEPQVRLTRRRVFLRLPEVRGASGQRLRDTIGNDAEGQNPNLSILTQFGTVDAADSPGTVLKEVIAETRFTMVTRFRRIEIDGNELAKGAQFQSDGLAIELLSPSRNPNTSGVDYTVVFRPLAGVESGKSAAAADLALIKAATLCAGLDQTSRPLPAMGTSSSLDDAGARVTLMSNGNPRPARLLVLVPLKSETVTPRFRFGTIPLAPVQR